tara:strand:+ start:2325 stop:2519 length:195 start_codon:yes stop_codon:yes gene_type:complete
MIPQADINKKLKVQKMLKSISATYSQLFKLLAPHQYRQRSLHFSLDKIMKEFTEEYIKDNKRKP